MARPSGRRTDYTWQGGVGSLALSSDAAVVVAVIGALGGPATLMRCRGEMVASIDTPTLNDKVIVGLGLIRVTAE